MNFRSNGKSDSDSKTDKALLYVYWDRMLVKLVGEVNHGAQCGVTEARQPKHDGSPLQKKLW